MTQNLFSSIQTDTMVFVRLDGLIEFLQCLSLEDSNALSRGLGIGINTSGETPDDTVTTETPLPTPPAASDNSPAVTVTSMEVPIPTPSTPTAAAPAIPAASDPTIPTTPAPTAAAPTGHTTILVEFNEYDDSDDEDSAMAAAALVDNSILHFHRETYFNVPAVGTTSAAARNRSTTQLGLCYLLPHLRTSRMRIRRNVEQAQLVELKRNKRNPSATSGTQAEQAEPKCNSSGMERNETELKRIKRGTY
ncbi:uncharacterized protein EDB91DRAFT_1256320 [Suillus paluster]|uniref:uncharacterized protein n=1 Tax=Suillus paluster TaxID=48578 RepID=UPI001B88132C|nr:uncharacterized protein EDB91DRAFT_1256320 [Suillus paluster]KAG1721859.1 hypothetical protein EDB91DRAFT_1256320 [Suillus paluster]